MRIAIAISICVLSLSATQRVVAQAGDTITLTVGHPSVDGTMYKEHWASAERSILKDGKVVQSLRYRSHTYVTTWHGAQVCVVESVPGPDGTDREFYEKSVLDQKSTALVHIEARDGTGRTLVADVDGKRVTGKSRASRTAPEEQLDFTLDSPSFYSPFVDAAIGATGIREGQVWRVPVFSFGRMGRKTEWHTLRLVGRESSSAPDGMAGAWIVEDPAGQSRIWITMEPPYLPQVLHTLPDGSVARFASKLLPPEGRSLGTLSRSR
jgi:hypothetical protein